MHFHYFAFANVSILISLCLQTYHAELITVGLWALVPVPAGMLSFSEGIPRAHQWLTHTSLSLCVRDAFLDPSK